jgi:sulfite reductase alpha subunit-like flavoprotein
MPKAVKKAFLKVFATEGGLEGEAGEKYWDRLEKMGRIVEETWA